MNIGSFLFIFFFGLGLIFLDDLAQAASVKSVNRKKSTVTIDQIGEEEGITKNVQVCIYDDGDIMIGCGVVQKVKKNSALLKIKSRKRLANIKAGMSARVKPPSDVVAEKKSSKKTPTKHSDTSAEHQTITTPFRVWGLFSPALATPAIYNKLVYTLPNTTAPSTLWDKSEVVSTSFFAFNFQLGIPIASFSINPGLRIRSYNDSQIDAAYSKTDGNRFLRTQQKASAIGIWTDFQYFHTTFTDWLDLALTSGLDLDMSSINFKASEKSDLDPAVDTTVAEAKSSLTVVSLRLGAGLDVMLLGSVGAHVGTTVMVPLLEMAKKFSGTVDDAENAGDISDPAKDLAAQLGHKKNAVAYEASLGVILAF